MQVQQAEEGSITSVSLKLSGHCLADFHITMAEDSLADMLLSFPSVLAGARLRDYTGPLSCKPNSTHYGLCDAGQYHSLQKA